MPINKGEYLKKSLKSKDVFYYKDEKEGFDVLSRVVYKTKPVEVHFPFDRNGSQKYKYIHSIEFHQVSPSAVGGVYKAVNFGLGLTRNLSPIIYRLEALPAIGKIIISSKLDSNISVTAATFNTSDLEGIFRTIKPLKEVQ
jgi:hypothetical protein